MRKATEAQKQRAAERRQRMRELSQKIEAMNDAQRAELVQELGAVPLVSGSTLSLHNTCLVLTQAQGAGISVSVVGGFQQWKQAGRIVKKGQHGFGIWVPVMKGNKDGAPAPETTEGEGKPGFVLGTVFDISQTEPLTEQATPEQEEAQ